MTLAALEATLRLYDGETAAAEVPVLRLLSQPTEVLLRRARRLRAALAKIPGLQAAVKDGVGYSGGGTLPEISLSSKHVRIRAEGISADDLAAALRRRPPPVVGMVSEGEFVLDVRTIADDEIGSVIAAFRGCDYFL
jgi:L-seryl-tRNA(Ser) seleniumtransferase